MESVGELDGPTGANSNLLSLPEPCPWDEDEESLGLDGIKPKSSPIPRRRSSVSSDDFQPPPSSSRRVSFADAFGLTLVSVKQFDAWAVTVPSGPLDSDLNETKEYYTTLLFTLPQTTEELALRVLEQKIELESLELLPGTTTLRGFICVLNLCFDKMVYVRTSLDAWRSNFDLLAEYVPESSHEGMDCFSFKLTLVPPFGEEGARVDFCLRYETPLGTFWANNNEKNYGLVCYERAKVKPQSESENRRKSCLKTTSSKPSLTVEETSDAECPDINLNSGKVTDTETQNANSVKLQKESKKELMEEMSRNRSRRNSRRAARLAKVQEHFAQRKEEEKEGTKTKETNVQECASMLVETTCSPLSQQTTAGTPTCNQTSPSPAESLEPAGHRTDSTDISSQVQVQHEDDTKIHFETTLSIAQANLSMQESISCDKSIAYSASEVLGEFQNTEKLIDQTTSITQPDSKCDNLDSSVCNSVEKAWEHFEQDAKQRIRSLAQSSKTDDDVNISKGTSEHKENINLKTSNHGFTFGTIVAPLYHQVFKKIEAERKDSIQKALQVDKSFKEPKDEGLRAVMPPENNHAPARQTTEIWPDPHVSRKQTVHDNTAGACKDSTEQHSVNTAKSTKHPLFETNKSKHFENAETSYNFTVYQNASTSGIRTYPMDDKLIETNLTPNDTDKQVEKTFLSSTPSLGEHLQDYTSMETLPACSTALTELSLQDDPCHSPCLLPLQGPEPLDTTNQTIQLAIENLPEQTLPLPTTVILKTSSSTDNYSFDSETLVSQNQEDTTNIQTQIKIENENETQITTVIDNNLHLNPVSEKIAFVVPQSLTNLNSSQTQLHITSILNQSSAEPPTQIPISENTIVLPNLSTTSSVQTQHSNCSSSILSQTQENPNILQASGVTVDSSDDKLELVCYENTPNNEKLNEASPQIHMNNTLECCKINEKKEQTLMDFKVQTSETENSKIIDKTNFFYGEHGDMSVIAKTKEIDDIKKGKLDNQDENNLCWILEGEQEEEEERENQVMQVEKKEKEQPQDKEEEKEEEQKEQKEDENEQVEHEKELQTEEQQQEEKVNEQQQEDKEQEENKQQEENDGHSKAEEDTEKSKNNIEDDLKYIDEEDDLDMDQMETEKEQHQQTDSVDQISLEREPEEQDLVISTSNVDSLSSYNVDLDEREEQQCTTEDLGGVAYSKIEEKESNSGAKIKETGTALTGSDHRNDWNILNVCDGDEKVCCGNVKLHNGQKTTDDMNMLENIEHHAEDLNRDVEENVEDNASTESLIDDEMELYLNSLRNLQRSSFRESKRPSISRGRPLAMPSISESVFEDQPNSALEDATNLEDMMELERATLHIMEGNEHVIGRNVLWWKEFLSFDNMSRLIGYTFLLIVFLVAAYYYDFIACFGLYLLTVYWLFQQGEGEPFKSSQRGRREPQ